jgi:hypothetical protein
LLGDDPVIATRRFRPQLARLLLLGPNGYARLAKRALGHADINITLSYLRMNRYIAMELTRRDHPEAPKDPASTFAVSEGELDDRKLSALVADLGRKGRTLRLVAPGVYCESSEENESSLIEFDHERAQLDAFAFALDKLASPALRAHPLLHAWFVREARRIAGRIDQARYEAPTPRHRRIAELIVEEEMAIAS